jgi:hypothetical protein
MYSTVLTIVKLISEGLTAGFGIYGLFTEFKDEHKKITRSGKIALSGIIAGFVLTCVMTGLEQAKERAADLAHAKEIRRLTSPLGQLSIAISFRVDEQKQGSGPYRTLREFFEKRRGADKYRIDGPSLVIISHQDLPPDVRDALTDIKDVDDTKLNISHEQSCAPRPLSSFDMFLAAWPSLQQSQAAYWSYRPNTGEMLYTRTLMLNIFARAADMTSVEDVRDSTMRITSSAFKDPELTFNDAVLKVAEGSEFQAMSSQVEKTKTDYCYIFRGQKQEPAKPSKNEGSNEPSTWAIVDREPEATKPDSASADWWLAVFTGALVVFTAALVIVGYLQNRTLGHHEEWMRKNVDVVTKIAEAAESSAKTARDSLTVTDERLRASNEAAILTAQAAQLNAQAVFNSERPWIVVGFEPRNINRFAFQVTNYGRTPAEVVSAKIEWTTVADDLKDMPVPPSYGTDVLRYRKLVPPTQAWEFDFQDLDSRVRSTPEILKDKLRLILYGCVRYHDLLDSASPHETRFCYRYVRDGGYLTLAGPEEYNQRT